MLTVFFVILGLILLALTPTFIRGFMEGFRGSKPPPPSAEDLRTLWYDLVYERKPRPKHNPKLRVIWPPDEKESKR